MTPALWYDTLARVAVVVCIGNLLLSGVCELITPRIASPATRIQAEKKDPPQYLQEALLSTLTMFIISTLLTWVVAQWRRGEPTAFKASLEEASWGPFPRAFYLAKIAGALLLSDAWTFWKHYLLHNPALYAIHK